MKRIGAMLWWLVTGEIVAMVDSSGGSRDTLHSDRRGALCHPGHPAGGLRVSTGLEAAGG
jgi:hypothetical protein